MIVRFHPVADNPIRMGYVEGWQRIEELVERLSDFECAVGDGRVVPAVWEPHYRECPSCRHTGAYAWARSQLQDPYGFATALALFCAPQPLTTRLGHANWLLLSVRSEPSQVTRELMLAEALGLWEVHASDWLQSVAQTCAGLGLDISLPPLAELVQQALQPLRIPTADEPVESSVPSLAVTGLPARHGFDKQLLQVAGWTPDPGAVILPVDSRAYALVRHILLLEHDRVVLLRAGKRVRSVPWDKIAVVHVFEGAVTFEIVDEPPVIVAGYQRPEEILRQIQDCYKAAVERALQAVASKVLHPTP